uniref:Cysteine protease n=1 Tax=Hyaloperonospora arabidopsidis (strain Emoy2) TaxID=559515 RepID=M4BGZ8_HYAAE
MAQFTHGISALDVTPASALSAPVWLLGRRFEDVAATDFEAYKRAFESILWFTYRRDFVPMTPYEFSSDAGWGCMLRSAQMLLGQALQRQLNGRLSLRMAVELESGGNLSETDVKLLTWFADAPDSACRYSIHHMVQMGMRYDKLPGEWYGPTTAAQVLRDLVNQYRRDCGETLAMYVPQEGVVYRDDVTRLCVSHLEEEAVETKEMETQDGPAFFDPLLHPPAVDECREWSTALLILIPLRLGLDQLNERYVPALEKTFTFPQSVGIIGGKRGHSVYFVGTQQNQLHLLDPHDVHPAPELNAAFPTATHLRTVHSSRPLVMDVNSIDPSLALGFLCENRADYIDFERRVRILHDEVKASGDMCPFSVANCRPDYTGSGGDLLISDCLSGDDMNEDELASANGVVSGEDDDDEYVLL